MWIGATAIVPYTMEVRVMMKQSIYFCLCLLILVGICCACKPKPTSSPFPENAAILQRDTDISSAENPPTEDSGSILCEGEKCDNGAVECHRFRVAPSGAEFKICLFFEEDSARLTLSRLDNPSMIYEDIRLNDVDSEANIGSYITIDDLNFDGKKEFMVYQGSGYGSNVWYHAFLWSEESQNFVEIPGFIDICSPEIRSEDQTIVSFGRVSFSVSQIDTYRWIDGNLIKVESHIECPWNEDECEQEVSD